MAERWAVATGNWSATSTWNGLTTLPGAGDTVHGNTYTVTIDQDITVGSIRTDAGATPVAGGGFTISSSRTLTGNVVAGSTDCLTVTGTPTVTIIGNITGGASTNADGMVCASGSTVNITGAVTGGTATSANGILQSSTSVISIIGNVAGGTGVGAIGVSSSASTSLTITGSVTAGNNATTAPHGVAFGTGSLTINTGPITGGASANTYGVNHSSGTATLIDINCDIVGGTGSGSTGCAIQSAVTTCTVDGNMTGGTNGGGLHFNIAGSTCTITGNAQGSGQYGLRVGSGTVNMTGGVTASTTSANGTGMLCGASGMVVTLTGNVQGGTNASYAASGISFGAGTLTINGDVTAGAGGHGITMSDATGLCTINGTVVGNARGTGSTDTLVYGVNYTPIPTSGYCKVRSVRCGANGMWPISGPVYINNIHQGSVKVRNSLLDEGRYTLNRVTKGTVMGGDYQVGDIIYLHAKFRTTPASLTVAVYSDDSTTEITTGVTTTYTSGFDAVAGLVSVKVDTASGYTTGKDYTVVVTAGTVYGDSIVGEVIGSFSLAKQSLTTAAGIRTAVGLASANLDTQLTTIDDFLDTEVAAIKAKTDNLPADPADASDIAATLATIAGYTDTVETGIGTVIADTTTIKGYLDTEIAAIKAKTDNLPSDPADASDVAASFSTVNSTLSTIAGYIDTEVAAIKAKTDNLPAAPAATGDCITAAGVRTAVGLASANIDTQFTNVPKNVWLYDMLAGIAETVPRYSPWSAMRRIVCKWNLATTTLTQKKEDGTTTAFTTTVELDGDGEITGDNQ